jgi:IrrE N-terminal-like domain
MLGQRQGSTRLEQAWPRRPFARVPTESGARVMASRVRSAVLDRRFVEEPLLDLSDVCEAAGVTVREALLSGERGGQEALLTPLEDDRFAIVVDATPRGGWRRVEGGMREDLRRHRIRFRVAHELAHTLFYWRRGNRPQRHLLDSASQERFCDAFGRALLVPPGVVARMPVNARTIIELQDAFDVSLEVAARSLATAHPQAFIGLWFAYGEGDDQLHLQWCSGKPTHATHCSASALFTRGTWLPERRQLLLCRA